MKTIEIDDRTITAKELTVADVRGWVRDARAERVLDIIDDWLIPDLGMTLQDVVRMSDLSMSDIDEMTPREIREVMTVCREANPDFFTLRARLEEAGARMNEEIEETPDSGGEPLTGSAAL